MIINIDNFYENCLAIDDITKKANILLEKILNIKNPMKFDDNFASEEDLESLEKMLDNTYSRNLSLNNFKEIFKELKPVKALRINFI